MMRLFVQCKEDSLSNDLIFIFSDDALRYKVRGDIRKGKRLTKDGKINPGISGHVLCCFGEQVLNGAIIFELLSNVFAEHLLEHVSKAENQKNIYCTQRTK